MSYENEAGRLSEDSPKEYFDNGNDTFVDVALTLDIRLGLPHWCICNVNDFREKVFLEDGPEAV